MNAAANAAAPVRTTDVAAAAARLKAGGLVAFATETVYGLGADAANADAVAAVYCAKQRPAAHPVIVHLADFSAAAEWAASVPAVAAQLAARFMPGALTVLLPRQPHIRHLAGGELIALRVPAHPLAQQLLRAFGGGVVAPSANRFGGVSPTSAAHVADEFPTLKNLLILDGGDCQFGIESTIVGFASDDAVFIVRPGSINAAMLQEAGVRLTAAPTGAAAVAAPGTLERHYAPRAPLLLVPPAQLETVLAEQTAPVGVLSRTRPRRAEEVIWQQAAAEPAAYAHDLYRRLRQLDAAAVARIVVEEPPAEEAWAAIRDRLRRAGSGMGGAC